MMEKSIFTKGVSVKKTVLMTLGLASIGFLQADEAPLPALKDHRLKFGLLSLEYDYLKPDNLYFGAGGRTHWTYQMKDMENPKPTHYYGSLEGKMGYNIKMSENQMITPYAGVSYTHTFKSKEDEYIKNVVQGTIGFKTMYRFGPIFSLGAHFKANYPLYQQEFVEVFSQRIIPNIVVADNVPATEPVSEFSLTTKGKKKATYEVSIPIVWNLGEQKNWEIEVEPSYASSAQKGISYTVGSRLTLGYRF